MNVNAIESAISRLANTMRLYGETQIGYGRLFRVDRKEAVNNLDRALEAKLEAFHTLYDASKRQFPYFDHGDCTCLIVMRNAIHHRDHQLFKSFQAEVLLADPRRHLGASYLQARHKMVSGEPSFMEHYFRIDDFRQRLCPSPDPSSTWHCRDSHHAAPTPVLTHNPITRPCVAPR